MAKETSIASLWLKLKSLFMMKLVTNRLLLKSQLRDLQLVDGKPVKPHLNKFNFIVMDLQNIEVKLEDEDLAIRLLCSLSPKHKYFREFVLYGRDELTLEVVKNSLLQQNLIEIN